MSLLVPGGPNYNEPQVAPGDHTVGRIPPHTNLLLTPFVRQHPAQSFLYPVIPRRTTRPFHTVDTMIAALDVRLSYIPRNVQIVRPNPSADYKPITTIRHLIPSQDS